MSHRTIFEPQNHTVREGKGGKDQSEQGAGLPERYDTNRQLAAFFARSLGFDPQGGLPTGTHVWPSAPTGTVSGDAPKSDGVVQGENEGYVGPLTRR
jgi:hypothetical protein